MASCAQTVRRRCVHSVGCISGILCQLQVAAIAAAALVRFRRSSDWSRPWSAKPSGLIYVLEPRLPQKHQIVLLWPRLCVLISQKSVAALMRFRKRYCLHQEQTRPWQPLLSSLPELLGQ